MGLFLVCALTGAFGAITGWLWGHIVSDLQHGEHPFALVALLVVSLIVSPVLLAVGDPPLPAVVDRGDAAGAHAGARTGRPSAHRLERTPPGEVVARTMDADRMARYADRWVDFLNGLAIAVVTARGRRHRTRRRACSSA